MTRLLVGWLLLSIVTCASWSLWRSAQKRQTPPNRKRVPTLTVVERGGCLHVEFIER